MGCFFRCFGSSKDRRSCNQRQSYKVQPRHQKHEGFTSLESEVSLVQQNPEKPIISPVSEIRNESEEQLGLSSRKKVVAFDSNVKAYEHVSVEASAEISKANEDGKKEENLAKPSLSHSPSEGSSITSSSGSYPPNHRYQNCRDSDNELDYEESDVDNNIDNDEELDYDDIYEDDGKVKSRLRIPVDKVVTEEIGTSMLTSDSPERREITSKRSARDRSAYVHPVLNPVENLTQWNALKGKRKPPLQQQKENLGLHEEPQIPFSSEPCFSELSFSFKSNSHQSKESNQETVAVDASLSNWLGLREREPVNKPSTIGSDAVTPKKDVAAGSSSPSSFDDRPILGALTVEELKQLQASCSPKRSPSRSPDETPIIGTVGTYWHHNGSNMGSGSALPFGRNTKRIHHL